jgi:hypothetical protein
MPYWAVLQFEEKNFNFVPRIIDLNKNWEDEDNIEYHIFIQNYEYNNTCVSIREMPKKINVGPCDYLCFCGEKFFVFHEKAFNEIYEEKVDL